MGDEQHNRNARRKARLDFILKVLCVIAAVLVGVAAVITATTSSHGGILSTIVLIVTIVAASLIGGFAFYVLGDWAVHKFVFNFFIGEIKKGNAPTLAVVALSAVQIMLGGTADDVLNGHPVEKWIASSVSAILPLIGYLIFMFNTKARDRVVAVFLILVPVAFVIGCAIFIQGWWSAFKMMPLPSRAAILGVVVVWIVSLAITSIALFLKRKDDRPQRAAS